MILKIFVTFKLKTPKGWTWDGSVILKVSGGRLTERVIKNLGENIMREDTLVRNYMSRNNWTVGDVMFQVTSITRLDKDKSWRLW